MFNRSKLIVTAIVAVGFVSPVLAASPQYRTMRLPGGARPDQYVFVRVGEFNRNDRPYALTGDSGGIRASRAYVPTHPKGTHSN